MTKIFTVPLFIGTKQDEPREDLPFEIRQAVTAIVYDNKTNKYLALCWKEINWETFITGDVEEGQTAEQAARAEVLEESGFKNLRLVKELPRYDTRFYHTPKRVNRFAHFTSYLFELINNERQEITAEEEAKHECIWLDKEELRRFNLSAGQRFLLESI